MADGRVKIQKAPVPSVLFYRPVGYDEVSIDRDWSPSSVETHEGLLKGLLAMVDYFVVALFQSCTGLFVSSLGSCIAQVTQRRGGWSICCVFAQECCKRLFAQFSVLISLL